MGKFRISAACAAAFCALSFVLTSCGGAAAGAQTTTSADTAQSDVSTTDASETTADPAYICEAPISDCGGRTFTFLLLGDGVPGDNWCEIDIVRDELNGEVINDAIITRNRDIENSYNVSIKGLYDNYDTTKYGKFVKSGDSAFDAAFQTTANAANDVTSGYCIAFNDIPSVDVTKGYWDHSIVKDLSIENKIYLLTGDISTIDNQATWTMMFNKDLITKYSLTMPYDYVLAGKWTLDQFSEMIKGVSADINGDGVMDQQDQYGLTTTADTIYGLFYSCGDSMIDKDSDDKPVLALDGDKLSGVFSKTVDIMSANTTLVSGRIKNSADVIIEIRKAFTETRALFYCEVMFHIANLRQMENDFGIIPMPKYDEVQENYITFVNPAANLLTVPKTNTDLPYTGMLLEAFAASSYNIVTPAYYNTALESKYARDEESKAMLDILLVNRTYDLGLIYGWGSFMTKYNADALGAKDELASLLASSESKVDAGISKFLTSFETNNA